MCEQIQAINNSDCFKTFYFYLTINHPSKIYITYVILSASFNCSTAELSFEISIKYKTIAKGLDLSIT